MSILLQPAQEERLRSDLMIWFTTVRSTGQPHSVPVWFLWEPSTLLIWSKPATQKVRNLHQNHFVTVTLDNTKGGHDVLILEGTAELLAHQGGEASIEAYAEKYREGLQRIGVTAQQFTQFYSQPIRFTPERLLGGQ